MGDRPRLRLGALTIAAERPLELARFYSRLLNWPYVREEPPDYALVCPPDGVNEPALNFEVDLHYRRPVWPSEEGEQIPSQHLDIGVDDLDAAVAWAVECGATEAGHQPNPTSWRVMLDPDGHPFCLCS